MARDGSGTYTLPPGNPVVTETVISSTTHNTTLADVATALTQSVARDGQTTMTGNQSMGGFRHTQVANGTARDQYTTVAQVQDGNLTLIGSLSGTDTLTGTISPAITAYANGAFLTVTPVNNNTGPVTLSLNGLGARPMVKFNSVPLVAGDLLTGVPATLVYNGTSFYLENPQVPQSDVARLSQANTYIGTNTFNGTTAHVGASSFTAAGTGLVPTVNLSASFPILGLNNTAASANNRSWLQYVDTSGAWVLRADLDDHTAAGNAIIARRNAQNVTSLELTATAITVNGVNVTDYARLSQANVFLSTITARAGNGQGSVSLSPGGVSAPGYIQFFTGDGTRRGYIGFQGGTNELQIATETGWTYQFNTWPGVNGVFLNEAEHVTTGTFAAARISEPSVTQHQAALAISGSQVSAATQAVGTSNTTLATTAFANPARSAAANGYFQTAGGDIVQYGASGSIGGGSSAGQSFAIAFPTACRSVQITRIGSGGTAQAADYVTSVTTSGFTLGNASNQSCQFYWQAIGY